MISSLPLRRLTLEASLYLLALLLALFLRVHRLAAVPLSDLEAGPALAALHAFDRSAPLTGEPIQQPGSQPAYLTLTAAAIALFGDSTAAARFWPALAGSLLVLLPIFFRRPLGRPAAILLAFGLAIDPGLAAASRLVGGPILALTAGLLALGAWHTRRPLLAGVLAGLALLSGPSTIHGAVILLLAWAITGLLIQGIGGRASGENQIPPSSTSNQKSAIRNLILSSLLTALLLSLPSGLSGIFAGLAAYWQGWGAASAVPAGRLLLALFVYQPFALIFAIAGLVRVFTGRVNEDSRTGLGRPRLQAAFLGAWALVALLLALAYPARQVADLVWVLVPLWALAAIELARHLPGRHLTAISVIQAVLLVILLGLFWFNLAAASRAGGFGDAATLRLGVMAGVLALGALTTVLIALGWSWPVARRGLVWGLSAAAAAYLLSALWGAVQLRPNLPQELWAPQPAVFEQGLAIQTLQDLSEWSTGNPYAIDVVSLDAPSLRWALRNFPNASFVQNFSPEEMPSALLTRQAQDDPRLAASYRGQDFTWWLLPGWAGPLPPDLLGWLAFRHAPVVEEQLILWARTDLFPGSQ